jgi:beta-galactosidase
LTGYALVLVPCLPHVSGQALAAFVAADGQVLYGPRTGSKTRDFRIPDNLPPGPLAELIPMKVAEVSSMRPGLVAPVTGALAGDMVRWREHVESVADAVARYDDGKPAIIASGRHTYCAGWPDVPLLAALVKWVTRAAGVATIDLPEAVRLRRRGPLTFAFNYGDTPWKPPHTGAFLLGGPHVDPQDLAAW